MTTDEKVEKIMTNHLPHLAIKLAKVEAKVDLVSGGIVAIFVSVIAGIILQIVR